VIISQIDVQFRKNINSNRQEERNRSRKVSRLIIRKLLLGLQAHNYNKQNHMYTIPLFTF